MSRRDGHESGGSWARAQEVTNEGWREADAGVAQDFGWGRVGDIKRRAAPGVGRFVRSLTHQLAEHVPMASFK